MKTLINLSLGLVVLLTACSKEQAPKVYNISSKSVNTALEVPYDDLQSEEMKNMQTMGEAILFSSHELDVNEDGVTDLTFEIVDLRQWNGEMPEHPDHLAARVITKRQVEIIDNSKFGYPDAMVSGEISEYNPWSNRGSFALGTIAGGGQFEGKGERYLAFRIKSNDGHNYGWVKLDCSATSDVLKVIAYGINKEDNQPINAGQKK